MTASQISYRLTNRIKRTQESKGNKLVCRRCQKPIVEGETVHRKMSGGHGKFYHLTCWNNMFFEVKP